MKPFPSVLLLGEKDLCDQVKKHNPFPTGWMSTVACLQNKDPETLLQTGRYDLVIQVLLCPTCIPWLARNLHKHVDSKPVVIIGNRTDKMDAEIQSHGVLMLTWANLPKTKAGWRDVYQQAHGLLK